MGYICVTEKCKGCGLCQNICPTNCISLDYDKEGFIVPIKDMDKCIRCNLCNKTCIVNRNDILPSDNSIFYCAQSLDIEDVENCTSGGIFGELARTIIEKFNGIVYGAIFDNNFCVKHDRSESVKDILPMHYSKYVQSNTADIYKKVKEDLCVNRNVLFTGTPCQIVALKNYLGEDYKNLICMDVLCFGVMSTSVLHDYIRYVIPKEENIENLEVCFRSKKISKTAPSFVLSKDSNIIYNEPFYGNQKGIGRGFGGAFINRVSCTECEFKQIGRFSDITVGDYVPQNLENDFSHSLVLINSRKGDELFKCLSLNKRLLSENEKIFVADRVNKKNHINKLRGTFFELYLEQGITEKSLALWKCKTISNIDKVLMKINRIFKWK